MVHSLTLNTGELKYGIDTHMDPKEHDDVVNLLKTHSKSIAQLSSKFEIKTK